jgi:hypothetical protein
LLYIEGAQYIDEEDGRWEFVTLWVFRPPYWRFRWRMLIHNIRIAQVWTTQERRFNYLPLCRIRFVLLFLLLARHEEITISVSLFHSFSFAWSTWKLTNSFVT